MQKKGFTLIELLIIVAIVCILVSVVVVSVSGSRKKAQVARFKQTARSIQTAAIKVCDESAIDWNVSLGTIPSNIGAIIDNGQSCGPGGATTFNARIVSADLADECIAVINQTGIVSFAGC